MARAVLQPVVMTISPTLGIAHRLHHTDIAQARARVANALRAEGFGVLTEIDLQATFKAKLGVDIAPYVVLGACNPHLAHRALQVDARVGLLLPCNVVLAQDGDDVVVTAASPEAMFGLTGETGSDHDGELAKVATEAEDRMRRAIAAI